MRARERKFVFLFALMLAAALVMFGATAFHTTSAAAVAQDHSRSDVKQKARSTHTSQPSGTPAPSNDNCANAVTVAICPFEDQKNTDGATDEASEPQSTCTLQANSVWYTVPASASTRTFTVSTCNSDFDTAISVWQVNAAQPCDFASFVAAGCNDDFCGDGLQSTVQFTANPGATYKIQVGGFDGETGNLTTDITCQTFLCAPVVINGTLGIGDPNFTGTQTHGTTVGRLNRNGISSTCAAPKTCLIFDTTPGRAFDTYAIPNQSGAAQCVSISLSEPANATCNIQSNAYLGTFNGASICTNYLGDPGLSTGVPPTATNFSVTVPIGQTLTIVVMTTNPGETGCPYTVSILGDLCQQFDYCVQADSGPKKFILINSTTGAYKYQDCSKGLTISSNTGGHAISFCKTEVFDFGPNPKKPDRFIDVLVNPCTKVGDATVQFGATSVTLHDSNITNNSCQCP